ncbi:hypothetical protein [Streptomyces sp. NPDC001978]|uniref:hypothetical protein n=1 Tax=Streptomyces sp. NPDC001978 TaxID=3364627 RepID=UPI0036B30196
MTRQRFDHSQCDHPSTKAGRAGCRKKMRDAALGETAAAKAATNRHHGWCGTGRECAR